MSLEESEEEAEGGEELLGKSPVDAFGPLPHTGSLPALPPGGAEGQPAATTKGQEDRGCLGSARGDASGAVRLEVLEENPALRGCGIPCQSSLPTSPSPACLEKEGAGMCPAVAEKTPPLLRATPRPGISAAGPYGDQGGRGGRESRHPWLRWRGKVGLSPLNPPVVELLCAPRSGPSTGGRNHLQNLLAPSPGRGLKVLEKETTKTNVGHFIDCYIDKLSTGLAKVCLASSFFFFFFCYFSLLSDSDLFQAAPPWKAERERGKDRSTDVPGDIWYTEMLP